MLGTNEHAQFRKVNPKLMSKYADTMAFPDRLRVGTGVPDKVMESGSAEVSLVTLLELSEKTPSEKGGHKVPFPVMSLFHLVIFLSWGSRALP